MGPPLSLLPCELLFSHVLALLPLTNVRGVSRAFRAGFDACRTSLKIEVGTGADATPDILSAQLVLRKPALKELQVVVTGREAPFLAAHEPGGRVATEVLRAAAARCCQLRSLSLSGDFSQAGGLATPLGEMSGLTQLELHDRSIYSDGRLAFLQAVVPSLQRLRGLRQLTLAMIYNGQHGIAAADVLAGVLPSLTVLESLGLVGLHPFALPGLLGETLQQLPWLRRLGLPRCMLQAEGCEGAGVLVPVLRALPALEALDLEGCVIGPEGAAALAPGLRVLSRLRSLGLNSTQLGSEGVAALVPALQALTGLESLGLGGNSFATEGAAALVPALRALTRLTRLDLRSSGLGPVGAVALAPGLQPLAALRELSLGSNEMGQDGVVALAPALQGMARLQTLGLSNNGLGILGVTAVLQLPARASLRQLDLGANGLSKEDAAELRLLFPDLP